MDLSDFKKSSAKEVSMYAAFGGAIAFGFLAHGTALFNKFCFHDDTEYLFDVGATYTSGRWMLDVYAKLETLLFGDGHFSLPLFNGFFSILCIAAAACLIVRLLNIRNPILCGLTGGLMVSFPAITGLFGYMFTAPAYMLAMLATVYGAYCICIHSDWRFYGLGTLLIGCAIGIYQAYVPLGFSLMLLYMICQIQDEQNLSVQVFWKKTGCILCCAVAAFLFYLIVNKLYLSFHDAELTAYMGISEIGSTSIREYISRVVFAYKRFLKLLGDVSYDMFPANAKVIYYLLLLVGAVLSAKLLLETWKVNRWNGFWLCGMLLLLPLAVNLIFVMAKPTEVHSLMVYAQIVPVIFVIRLLDQLDFSKILKGNLLRRGSVLVLLLLIIVYCRFSNQCYLKATFTQQQCINYFTTLITQIKSTDGYSDELPVVIINEQQISDQTLHGLEALQFIRTVPYMDLSSYVNNSRWRYFIDRWCAFKPEYADAADFENLVEVEQMPSYPDYGSIQIIRDTVVVKF